MDDVRQTTAQVDAMAVHYPMLDALVGGTSAMRKAGRAFLPQWPSEDQDSYKARLGCATLFPAYSRTCSVLAGKPFARPLMPGPDVPPEILPLLEDVDLERRNLHTFAGEIAVDALTYGLAGVLVDCPPANGVKTRAEELAAGIRPYFVHVRAKNIIGWRAERVGGTMQLTQLRLLESVEAPDGVFAVKQVEQVRLLEPGRWSLWRKIAADGLQAVWTKVEEGLTSLDVIPFVPVYGRRLDFMMGVPPMLELAHLNVEHWQSSSDQQTILHVARVPILFARGLQNSDIVVGANSFVSTGSETAELKYVEHSGLAIEAGRLSLEDLLDRMRQVGAELLVMHPTNKTVIQAMGDNEMGKCELQRIIEALEDCLDRALDLMAAWLRLPSGGHVQIFKDFSAITLDEASSELLAKMQQTGALSHETLLFELKRRGKLAPDLNVPEEVARARAEMPQPVVQEQVRV